MSAPPAPGFIYSQQPGGYQPLATNPPGGYQPLATNPYPNTGQMPMQYPNSPIYTNQPGVTFVPQTTYMAVPAPIEGVTPGLEYLTLVDSIVVHQLYEIVELLTEWETKNKYALKNENGEQVYFAAEESDCCGRQCCGNRRSFSIHIVDNFRREVITVRRPFKCCGGIFTCCAFSRCCSEECTIESPAGNVIGTVVQRATCCSLGFYVNDADGNKLFRIEGPCCCSMMSCSDKKFRIFTKNDVEIGAINKKWGGCFREAFTDADVFRVTFPMDLDVKMKAVLVGATFLIDFMAFEDNEKKSNDC